MSTLYLGSTSQSRQTLLKQALIPFKLVGQSADESKCDWGLTLQKVVTSIALYKMEHVVLPQAQEGERCFVLTADTLTEGVQGELEGKPKDRADAIAKLKRLRDVQVRTGTAFCLERKVFEAGLWKTEKQKIVFAEGSYRFCVPDHLLTFYLDNVAVAGAGAIAIEGFGNQFLVSLSGSYSAVRGLPMYELRQALTDLGFFS